MNKEQIDRLQALADLKTGDAHLDAMKAAACKAVAHRELTTMTRKERLNRLATEVREMHRLYPFTKTVSSAARKAKSGL